MCEHYLVIQTLSITGRMNLLILLGVLQIASVVRSDCTTRDESVGIGYNLIYGNPDGDDALSGRDPGVKYNYQILTISYDDENSIIVNGNEYCIPDQVRAVAVTSCSAVEETYLFSGTESYQEVFGSMVSVDSSYDNGMSSYEFSGSSEYQSVQEGSESTETVYFDKRVFCHESQARYRIENVANDDSYGVSTDFYNAFSALPDVSITDTKDETNLEDYYDFLTRWGTHIIEENNLGGQKVERYESTLTELYEYAQETSSTSISLGGSYGGYSASVSLDIDTLSETTSSSSEFGSYFKTITTGATLRYDSDEEHWYIPDDDTAAAEPTQLYLVSIAIVCEDYGYWSTVLDSDSDIEKLIANRCTTLETAISGYASYLGVSSGTDDTNLPIVWPDGLYGLLQSTDRCPTNTTGFSFQEGWRKLSNKKKKDKKNKYTDGHHFYGTFSKTKVTMYFCMKNTEEANSQYSASWPAGQYCIFRNRLGECPEDFDEGTVKWENQKKSKGSRENYPYGSYKKKKTKMHYCCRQDGSANEDIYLPTADPFYLVRKGDSCQSVSGMTVADEYMRIRNKEFKTSGILPYIDQDKRVYYCYYYPE